VSLIVLSLPDNKRGEVIKEFNADEPFRQGNARFGHILQLLDKLYGNPEVGGISNINRGKNPENQEFQELMSTYGIDGKPYFHWLNQLILYTTWLSPQYIYDTLYLGEIPTREELHSFINYMGFMMSLLYSIAASFLTALDRETIIEFVEREMKCENLRGERCWDLETFPTVEELVVYLFVSCAMLSVGLFILASVYVDSLVRKFRYPDSDDPEFVDMELWATYAK